MCRVAVGRVEDMIVEFYPDLQDFTVERGGWSPQGKDGMNTFTLGIFSISHCGGEFL